MENVTRWLETFQIETWDAAGSLASALASVAELITEALVLARSPAGIALALVLAAVLTTALLGGVFAWALLRRSSRSRNEPAFQAIAAEALRQNNEGFLALATEKFRALQESATTDLGGRHKAIEDLVGPLHEALAGYQLEARELERERALKSGQLGEQLRQLGHQTSQLAGALRSPGARGQWGELTLRRTVEMAGLSAHCDFEEQVQFGSGKGALRPDLVIRMPSGRQIAVDAKAPLDAYLAASNADDGALRDDAGKHHARQVRRHVEALAARGYAEKLDRTPEFVVLFLPHEGYLGTAVTHDRALVSDALTRGVVIATPATLYALLAAVSQGWREQQLADNTRKVLVMAKEMDDRLGILTEHLARLGGSLGRSVEQFNASVGSLETRVLSQARRMRELGVGGTRTLEAPAAIDTAVRTPRQAPDAPATPDQTSTA